ncbi:hypothetical protein ACHAO9_009051 [Fusarium lateritium]
MAPARNPVVAGLPSPSPSPVLSPAPAPAPASASASALATGYESPSEEYPPFFSAAATPATASDTRRSAVKRPDLAQRPSYITAIAPEGANSNNQRPARLLPHGSTLTSNSLNHVMATAEKSPEGRKVGLRDRIACHRWTYFTMTMSTGGIANILHSRGRPYSSYLNDLTDDC